MTLGLLVFQRLGGYPDFAARGSKTAFCLPIIAVARQDVQLRPADTDFQAVEAVLRQGNILGVKSKQILRTQVLDQMGEGSIELGPESWGKDMASGAGGEGGKRVF